MCVFACQCEEIRIAPITPTWCLLISRASVLSLVQVLSYNLYTVLNIPHDPVALEEHFQDDDEGPVSNHGYMPYLNKYILDKVENKEKVLIRVKYREIALESHVIQYVDGRGAVLL